MGGESYLDPAPVKFVFHRLQNYAQGYSYFYLFVKDGEVLAKNKYCDVGEAFDKELGLVQPRDTLFPR